MGLQPRFVRGDPGIVQFRGSGDKVIDHFETYSRIKVGPGVGEAGRIGQALLFTSLPVESDAGRIQGEGIIFCTILKGL